MEPNTRMAVGGFFSCCFGIADPKTKSSPGHTQIQLYKIKLILMMGNMFKCIVNKWDQQQRFDSKSLYIGCPVKRYGIIFLFAKLLQVYIGFQVCNLFLNWDTVPIHL